MKPSTDFRRPWARCVGSDRLSTLLRAEYWERFRTVQAVMGYEYIRCHGLLEDELGVVRTDVWEGRERTFYNFTYLDRIFDALRDHGVRPFVEWGFMPGALASGTQKVFWWEGNVTPPASQAAWADLVEALTRHWIDRYGLAEVRLWYFEVWNEPNLTQFWKDADQEAYFVLYETTVRTLKAVDSGLRVGGPAICGGSDHWIDDFLAFVRRRDLPLDFFSRHLYSGLPVRRRTPELFYQGLAAPDVPVRELEDVRRRIDAAGFSGLPLHITEFNTSYHPLCPVHDTPLNAAHLARLLSEAGPLAETMSYWTFTDEFEEADVPRAFFHGGFGLLARHGVPKPTFHLFRFFRNLGDEVVFRTQNALVTRTGRGLAVAAWNPVQTPGPSAEVPVTLELPWDGGTALVRRERVHDQAANPWGLWVSLGRPRFPDRATVELLHRAAVPAVEVHRVEPSSGGGLRVDLRLARNEVTFVEVLPFADESPTYWGLDDGQIDGYGPQRSLLADLGYPTDQVEARITEAWRAMFEGNDDERIYREDGADGGYLVDTGNQDVRTEGMSYGLMMAVQLDRKDVFDRLWRWSHRHLQHREGRYRHYFAWSANFDGSHRSEGPAPDGEEFFAMALLFAAHRWGEGPAPLDYGRQARLILRAMVHQGDEGEGDPMIDPATALIRFVPETPWTDPSYHLPMFYDLFARWADPEDRPLWRRAAEASRAFLPRACHPVTGLAPEYSEYDGSPHQAPWDYGHHHFFSDAYRVGANLGLEALWTGGRPDQRAIADRLLAFFSGKGSADLWRYAVDGTPQDEPALHPQGLLATLAAAALAATPGPLVAAAVRRFWDTPLRTGPRRYYDNCLQLFAWLALSGRYRIWEP